jgi:hypothetical protein
VTEEEGKRRECGGPSWNSDRIADRVGVWSGRERGRKKKKKG